MSSKYKPKIETINSKIGEVYGRLTIQKFSHIGKSNNILYFCKCQCGEEKIIRYTNLKRNATKSCGCLKKEIEISNRLSNGEAPKRLLYRKYINNAKSKKRDFDITYKDFIKLTSSICYYCGSEPKTIIETKRCDGQQKYIYNGLDRVNNAKDYSFNNVVPCCQKCNYLKSNFSQKDFLNTVKNIYENFYTKHREG